MSNGIVPVVRTIENGQEMPKARIDPQVASFVMQATIAAQLVRIRKLQEAEKFQGRPDVITLSATSVFACLNIEERWHKASFVTCYIANDDSTYSVEIGINEPSPVMTIKAKETRVIDHTKARERISRIFYRCSTAGQTVSVRVEGEY